MKCPVCKHDLVQGRAMELETLTEHVMCWKAGLKPSFWCENTSCELGSGLVCWNGDGELYVMGNYKTFSALRAKNKLLSPYGSFERKIDIEIRKDDEDIWIKLPFGWKIQVDWKYKSNMDGDILSKKPKLVFWHKGIMHISGISMLFYSLRSGLFRVPRKGDKWWQYVAYFFNKKIR